MALYKGLDDFRGESELWTWLYKIARNTRYQWFRRRKAREEVNHPMLLTDNRLPAAREIFDLRRSPEVQAEDEEHRWLLRQAIESLPKQQRDGLKYRLYHGLSYQEIADQMGISIQTVKAHLFQARKKLKERLRKRFGGIDF